MIYARTLNFTYITTSRSWKYRAVVIGDVLEMHRRVVKVSVTSSIYIL
ncbi:Protein of unknown function [Pyronema omphalodes CBS 100304]|uniref:Uncharacterized protein n=1 Tax=Pyronema omphalodes (strain CBS 100304) TaxID=1076935 RepID=U4LIU2_PYROM|nr:Protein of unknown function [Pyronema omphalodes CBS 100304]